MTAQAETINEPLVNSATLLGIIGAKRTVTDSVAIIGPTTSKGVVNLFVSINAISSIQSKTIFQLLENINISEDISHSQRAFQTVSDLLLLIADTTINLNVLLTDNVVANAGILSIASRIEYVSELLKHSSNISSRLVGKNSILEVLNLISSYLNNNQTVSVQDVITLSITSSLLVELLGNVVEHLLSTTTVVDSRGILVIADSTIEFLSNLSSRAVLSELLKSTLIFSIPNDILSKEYSTFVYTPETSSISTYNNYNFDGCYKFNDKYLFYNSTGLYEFGGDSDNSVEIIAKMLTPAYSFGTSNLKQIPSIYLGINTDDIIYLKVRVDGKSEVLYKLNKKTDNLETLKLSIGKGLIGRYFQFELETSAKAFDLESIEFFPIQFQRKL